MNIIAYDPFPAKNTDIPYADLNTVLSSADIISLHCPLTAENRHMINAQSLQSLKPGAILINTSRGALIDTDALVDALRNGTIAGAALDVYEEESDFFFEDHSNQILKDDRLARLLSFNNVIITSHQAFFTHDALQKIAQVTFANLKAIASGETNLENEICYRCEQFGKECNKKRGKPCF